MNTKIKKIMIIICAVLPALNLILMIMRWKSLQLDYEYLSMVDYYEALNLMFNNAMFDFYYFIIYTIVTWILTLVTFYIFRK